MLWSAIWYRSLTYPETPGRTLEKVEDTDPFCVMEESTVTSLLKCVGSHLKVAMVRKDVRTTYQRVQENAVASQDYNYRIISNKTE